MKQVTIAGNIGKDATNRQAGSGNVTGFSVAVEDRTGKEKKTIWFDVAIWGDRGTKLSPYLTKGTRVAVAGDLGIRMHEGKAYLTVRADQVTLMGGGGNAGGGQSQPDTQANGTARYDDKPSGYGADDDTIPF